MKNLFTAVLKHDLPVDPFEWLHKQGVLINQENTGSALRASFAAVPRKTGKQGIKPESIETNSYPVSISTWSIDRLSRVWLLLQVDHSDKKAYVNKINSLFNGAEMNELVALYSALPLLAYPEEWTRQCAEGIRSNIGLVLEAIMYDNPYPPANLDEAAWNQLVLKAFFTEKDVNRIIGIDTRANKTLAEILIDYAHERWAAHRLVNVQLWRMVSPFMNEQILIDVKKLFNSELAHERQAAALVCFNNSYEPAKQLLNDRPELFSLIKDGQLTWQSLNSNHS